MKEGFFESRFLTTLPSDSLEALVKLFEEFERFNEVSWDDLNAEQDYIESLAILRAFVGYRKIKGVVIPDMSISSPQLRTNIIHVWLEHGPSWRTQLVERTNSNLLEQKLNHYGALFDAQVMYEFEEKDYQRIQVLMNELRKLIQESNLISADHQQRLLRRLEAMQAELHKKTSDIDRFWGFVAEAGIVARKFGEDLKPVTDRVTELGKIVIGVVMAKEGIKALPAISNLFQLGQ